MSVNEVVDIDDMVDEPTPKLPKELSTLQAACNRYVFNFPDGQNPHTAYPFALVQNGIMMLYSWSCDVYSQHGDAMFCKACQGLAKNGSLDGIRTQIKDGVNKSAPLV